MKTDIDASIDSDYVYEALFKFTYGKGLQASYTTTINLYQKEVSIQRAIKKLNLTKEDISKVVITPIQQLGTVNYKG